VNPRRTGGRTPTPARPIGAILQDDVAVSRLIAAAGSDWRVECCQRAADAIALVRSLSVRLLVVAPRDRYDKSTRAAVQACRGFDPSLRVIAYGRADGAEGHELFTLASAGAEQVVIRDREDGIDSFRHVLNDYPRPDLSREMLDLLKPRIGSVAHPEARSALVWLAGTSAHATVSDLARGLRISPRTLLSWFARASLDTPSHVIALFRLIRVADVAADPHRTFEELATTFGFGSVANLRKSLRAHARLSLRDLRTRRGIVTLLDAIVPLPPPALHTRRAAS
jgi:AraC-like DNA-binding protein